MVQQQVSLKQHGLDHWFFHLVRWELRFMRGQRRIVWWIGMALLSIGVAYGVWRAATLPASPSNGPDGLRTVALAALLATPVRDQVIDLTQLTLGYDLMRFAAYAAIAFCKALLPAIAAGTIAGDRQAGRLQDLHMLPIRPGIVFLAKIVAAALPFLALSLLMLILFSGVAVLEYVPAEEAVRLSQETLGQILLTACVVVTCSSFFARTTTARMAAHLILWGALPAVWLVVLLFTSAVPSLYLASLHFSNRYDLSGAAPVEFGNLCSLQAALTYGLCLLFTLLGIRRLKTEDRTSRKRPELN